MSDRRIAWSNVSRGFYFVGFGIFLLLNTQGVLPWSFWRDAIAYWPVGLVALGIRLVFERSGTPWLALFGPVLVVGTLTHVAFNQPVTWERGWADIHADRPASVERWTVEGRLVMVDLDLTARSLPESVLVDGRISPAGREAVRTSTRGDAARVRIGRPRRTWSLIGLPARLHKLELGAARDLPVGVDLDIAFTDGRIDLAEAPVTGVILDGAFNDLTLRLGTPGSDVRLELNGAFNHIALVVPATVPVRIRTEGFLNLTDGRRNGGSRSGPGYRFDLDGAFNHLSVRSDD